MARMVERDWVGMAPPGVQPELLSSQLFQGFRTPASVLYSHQHLTTLFGAPLQGTMQGAMQGAMQGPMQGTTTAPPTYNPSGPSVLMPPAAPPPAISLLPPSDFRLNVFIPDSNRKFLVSLLCGRGWLQGVGGAVHRRPREGSRGPQWQERFSLRVCDGVFVLITRQP